MKRIVALLLACLILLGGCRKTPAAETQAPAADPETTVERSDWYNPAITDEQRLQFFELVKTWRVDAMYDFSPEQPMDLEFFKYYCSYFIKEEDKRQENEKMYYKGRAVEEIAKWFGMSYGLEDEDEVILKVGSLMDSPFAELIEYKEEQKDGRLLVTARCIDYGYNEFMYDDRVETSMNYTAYRQKIIRGEATPYDYCSAFDVSFYTEDGKTPTQFVSCTDYYSVDAEGKRLDLPDFK